MAGVLQHLRSSTLNKRPNPASMVDGQIAINYASGSPGAFFKDTNGNLVKVGPVHVGATAPNASPASGGTAGNSVGEQWLDTSGGTYVFKIWDGAAWRSEAGEFVNSTGDTMTGPLTMGPSANLIFEGSTDDGFETTLTVVDPTADRTITLPNVSGTVVTTGDSGTVTSTMIADGAIVNADVNASAAIAGTKISPDFGSQNVATTGTATAASFIPSSSSVPSNGLYLPSSNNVAISTNGTGRLFVDANGRVGVGVSSPGQIAAGYATIHVGGTSGGGVRMGTDTTPYGYVAGSLNGVEIGTTGATAFSVFTNNQTRATVTSDGKVGLGTSSPSEVIHVVGNGRVGNNTTNPNFTIISSNTGNPGANTRVGTLKFAANANNVSDITAERNCGITVTTGGDERLTNLDFYTSTIGGGAARVRIDSEGRVGVGTTSPGYALDVISNSTYQLRLASSTSNYASGGFYLGAAGTGDPYYYGYVRWNQDTTSLDIAAQDGTGSGGIRFLTNGGASSPTERMRIGANGAVAIGTTNTATGYRLNIDSANGLRVGGWGAGIGVGAEWNTTVSSTSTAISFSYSTTEVGKITTTSTATAYVTSSDYRLKENVTAVTDGIIRLQQLKPSRFNFIADPTKTVDGFIAHEVQTIVPEAIAGEKDEIDDKGNPIYQGIDQSKLVPLLTAALQEAVAKIESLEARLTAAGI